MTSGPTIGAAFTLCCRTAGFTTNGFQTYNDMDISNMTLDELHDAAVEASREELISMVLALYGAIKLKELFERLD